MNRHKVLAMLLSGLAIIPEACKTKTNSSPGELHQVQITVEGAGMMYADRADCRTAVQQTDSSGSETRFHCFKIGFIDSLATAKAVDKKTLDEGRYFQYELQNDWCILINGDSVKPVFFQPKQKTQVHRNEGILVFEVPGYLKDDTLVFTDSRGRWAKQQMIFKAIDQ